MHDDTSICSLDNVSSQQALNTLPQSLQRDTVAPAAKHSNQAAGSDSCAGVAAMKNNVKRYPRPSSWQRRKVAKLKLVQPRQPGRAFSIAEENLPSDVCKHCKMPDMCNVCIRLRHACSEHYGGTHINLVLATMNLTGGSMNVYIVFNDMVHAELGAQASPERHVLGTTSSTGQADGNLSLDIACQAQPAVVLYQEQSHAQLLTQMTIPCKPPEPCAVVTTVSNAEQWLPVQAPVSTTVNTMPDDTAVAASHSALQNNPGNSDAPAVVPMMTEPCSQLLEDTPIELWEFDGAAAVSLDESSPAAAPKEESAAALQQLEDFCRCAAIS